MSKLWGGRFSGSLDPFFAEFNRSLPYDRRLFDQDLDGSIAWAKALGEAGVLKKTEVSKLQRAIKNLRQKVKADPNLLVAEDEDIHSFVERMLGEEVGSLARKLHAGRSRNDQVATDLKLYLREAVQKLGACCHSLMSRLVQIAVEHPATPLPGYTHLQRAQPLTVGHHVLAYVEMLDRDRTRLDDAAKRMDTCPLGSAALAGSGMPVDRRQIAADLGFTAPTRNSIDSVADRDHVCELLFAMSMIMIHLSRLAEDWIFFASQEARFLEFSDAVATGSSLMPQKKNPDAMELIRGKAGRVAGHLNAMMMTLKGLPLAYNKDMQEDKEGLFDAIDTCSACLTVAATAASNLRFDRERCLEACSYGFLDSTDLADLLVAAGVPFRDAHERVGIAVRQAIQQGIELRDLPRALQQELFPEIDQPLAKELSIEKVLARRQVLGGSAPKRVRQEIKRWQKKLAT